MLNRCVILQQIVYELFIVGLRLYDAETKMLML